ncbi:MAG: hypothetical protein Q9202_002742 [Teloschistes flavicans]
MAHVSPTGKTRDRSKISMPVSDPKRENTTPTNGKNLIDGRHLIKSSTIRTMPKESPKPPARPTSTVPASAAAPTSSLKHRRLRTSDNSTQGTPTLPSESTSEKKGTGNKALSNPDRARSTSPTKATPGTSSKPSSMSSSIAFSRKPTSTNAHPSVKKTSSSASTKDLAKLSSATSNAGTKRSNTTKKRPGPDLASSLADLGRVTPTKATAKDLQTSPRKSRPALGTRKTTMSVTIEQRLREISVVHQMLQAAMADDGNEDDEVKEAYGKKMDETLAALKVRLQEAKSAEELVSPGNEPKEPEPPSEETLCSLGSGRATPPLAVIDDTATQDFHGNDTAKPAEDEKPYNEQLDKDDLKSYHDSILGEIDPELARTDDDDKENLKSLREENDDLRETIRTLKSDWQQTLRENNQISQSNDELRSSIFTKERQLLETQKNLRDSNENKRLANESHARSYQALCAERDSFRQSKQYETEQLQHTVKSLEDRCQELEDARKSETEQHREVAATLEEQIQKYEIAKTQAVEEHKLGVDALWQQMHEVQSRKDRELQHQSGVIEALQDQVRDLNEIKVRDIEATRQSLAQEHEEAISDVRTKLEAAFAQKAEDESQPRLDELRATLSTLHRINTELQQELDDTKIELEKHRAHVVSVQTLAKKSISALRKSLDATRQEYTVGVSNLHESIKALGSRLSDTANELIETRRKAVVLEGERDEAHLSLQTARKEMQQLSEKSGDQQSQYQDLETDYCSLIEQNEQVAKQLSDMKTKLERHTELEQAGTNDRVLHETQLMGLKEGHKVELQEAHTLADNYHKRIRELDSALKVTTAELRELQTQRSCSGMFGWANKGRDEIHEGDEGVAGVELSSHNQGLVCYPFLLHITHPRCSYRAVFVHTVAFTD